MVDQLNHIIFSFEHAGKTLREIQWKPSPAVSQSHSAGSFSHLKSEAVCLRVTTVAVTLNVFDSATAWTPSVENTPRQIARQPRPVAIVPCPGTHLNIFDKLLTCAAALCLDEAQNGINIDPSWPHDA